MDGLPERSGLLATDRPSEKLLNRVAQHIVYDNLSTIAVDVGVNRAELSRFKANFCSDAHMQIYETIFKKKKCFCDLKLIQ